MGARDAAVVVVDLTNAAAFVVCEEALRRKGRLLGAPNAMGTALRKEAPELGPAATGRGVAANMAVKEGREEESFLFLFFFFRSNAFSVFFSRRPRLVLWKKGKRFCNPLFFSSLSLSVNLLLLLLRLCCPPLLSRRTFSAGPSLQ